MVKAVGPPLFPFATLVFEATTPAFVVSLVTAEVATGFVVVQEKFILQLFVPEAITQEEAAGVRVPDILEKVVQVGGFVAPLVQEGVLTIKLAVAIAEESVLVVNVKVYEPDVRAVPEYVNLSPAPCNPNINPLEGP